MVRWLPRSQATERLQRGRSEGIVGKGSSGNSVRTRERDAAPIAVHRWEPSSREAVRGNQAAEGLL